MARSLVINGKEYVQSSVLTALYKYTPDYIGKLAREEKIIGTQVGRQWYIEPESLKIFLHKAAIEKEIRAEELSLKRKIEHQAFQKIQQTPVEKVSSAHLALAQMLAIIGCGSIAGVLGFSALSSNLTAKDLVQSGQDTTALFAERFSPVQAIKDFNIHSTSFLAASGETVADTYQDTNEVPTEIFTSLPIRTDEHTVSKSPLEDQFSDEVQIVVDQDGNEYLKPLFKNQDSGGSLFKVVPIEKP